MGNNQQIEIRGLRVKTFIGVPDEERAAAQEVRVHVKVDVATSFDDMADDIDQTLDYAALAADIQALGAARSRRLIETLASDIAELVLKFPTVSGVDVTIEKFILPDTDCVAVHLHRDATGF